MIELLGRILNFAALVISEQPTVDKISTLAHKSFFKEEEQDTAVYAYGVYDKPEHHSEEVLVVKFVTDTKVFVSWQGIESTVEANLPSMGWDYEDGEFGLGGDWWKR